MKKILVGTMLAITAITASAQHHGYRHHHHHHHGYYGGNWNWVLPAVIGGAIIYGATRPVQPAPPPVIIQQPLPPAPYGYRYEQILDASCNCYRVVLVQNF